MWVHWLSADVFPEWGEGEGPVLIEQEVYEKTLYFCYEPKMIYKIKF